VIPAAFDYMRPTSIEETLGLLVAHGPDAKVIAGGQSLLPLMKLRLARPERLIDIGRLAELRGIRRLDDGRLSIGALTTYDELLRDRAVTTNALMADALPRIGDIQVRNRGTIGGAIAHADPASDMPALLLALDAEVVARSRDGERTISMTEFITGPFTTALEPNELLIEIRLPASSGDYGSAYRAIEQPASGFAIAGAAVVIGRSGGDGTPIDDVRIALTGVGEQPYRATAAERAFRDSGDPAAAASHGTDGATVGSDIHADREYRTAMAAVQVRLALETAIDRLG
jgi:aerobic carbon-monoxide dehydrogenase medium subunit